MTGTEGAGPLAGRVALVTEIAATIAFLVGPGGDGYVGQGPLGQRRTMFPG